MPGLGRCGTHENTMVAGSGSFQFWKKNLCQGCSSKSKTKKIMYDLTENEDFDREEIPTYEVKLKNLSPVKFKCILVVK